MKETLADRYIALYKKRYENGIYDLEEMEKRIAKVLADPNLRAPAPKRP